MVRTIPHSGEGGQQRHSRDWRPTNKVDVSQLKPFIVATCVNAQAIAAVDLREAQVEAVIAHKGTPRNRTSLEFQVK